MALIWADDFRSYGTGSNSRVVMKDGLYAQTENDLNTQAGQITVVDDPDVSADASSVALRFSNNVSGLGDNIVRWVNPSGALTTIGVAFRLWPVTLPTDDEKAFALHFRNSSNADNCLLELMTTGQLRIRRGGEGGTVLGTSSIPVVTAASWSHIEIKVTFSDTVGTTEVRVNGVEVSGLSLTGIDNVNTAEQSCSQIAFVQRASGSSAKQEYNIKDFIVWDTTGSQNNDFFGTVQVLRLAPTADSSFNWAPSTGSTGWDLIDETGPSDADFISAADPPPAASSFEFENLPEDITSVRGLITLVRARKSDGGDGNLQVSLTSGGVDDAGADRPITTAYAYWWDVSELDPNTASAWTKSSVDAATIKVNRTL